MKVCEMSKVSKLSISLTKDLAAMIDEAVQSGSYSSNSEVMREALRDWRIKRARIHALQEKIQTGFDDLEAGRVTEVDSADALYQLIITN